MRPFELSLKGSRETLVISALCIGIAILLLCMAWQRAFSKVAGQRSLGPGLHSDPGNHALAVLESSELMVGVAEVRASATLDETGYHSTAELVFSAAVEQAHTRELLTTMLRARGFQGTYTSVGNKGAGEQFTLQAARGNEVTVVQVSDTAERLHVTVARDFHIRQPFKGKAVSVAASAVRMGDELIISFESHAQLPGGAPKTHVAQKLRVREELDRAPYVAEIGGTTSDTVSVSKLSHKSFHHFVRSKVFLSEARAAAVLFETAGLIDPAKYPTASVTVGEQGDAITDDLDKADLGPIRLKLVLPYQE